MTRAERELLSKIVSEDGTIRVLIYRSTSTGNDGKPRFVAQSLKYGQAASGARPAQALRRVLVQVVAYLAKLERSEYATEARRNWAPEEVLKAFSMARRFADVPDDLSSFFEAKHHSGFPVPQLVSIVEANELLEPLEDFVKKEQLVPSY